MKGKISYIDQNHFLYQEVNILFSAVKLGILTWGVYEIDSLLEPASSGHSMNCSLSHFRVGFKTETGRLPLAQNLPNFRFEWGFPGKIRVPGAKYPVIGVASTREHGKTTRGNSIKVAQFRRKTGLGNTAPPI